MLFSEDLFLLLCRDLVHAKRRRLRKAAEVRSATKISFGAPAGPHAEEATKPVVMETTEPAAEEAARPVETTREAKAPASPPPAEKRPVEVTMEKTPSPLRPTDPPGQQEVHAPKKAGSSTPASRGAAIEMEEDAPPQPPPSAAPVGEAVSSEATAGAAAARSEERRVGKECLL